MKVFLIFFLFFVLLMDTAEAPIDSEIESKPSSAEAAAQAPDNVIPMDPWKVRQNQKIAYLTFDDGPSTNTIAILGILDRYKIKATFFVMGREEPYAIKGYREIKKKGHTIAMHSFSHDYSTIYRSKEAYFEDLEHLESFLKKNFAITSNVVRFPGGSKNITTRQEATKHVVSDVIKEFNTKGYVYYDWNVDSKDGISPRISEQTIISSVLKGTANKDQAVILLHDINSMKNTVRALPDIIEGLKRQGFEFRQIDEYSPQVHFQ